MQMCVIVFNWLSVLQLDLITDLLGTPPLSALSAACEGAKAHILRGPHKPVRDKNTQSSFLLFIF